MVLYKGHSILYTSQNYMGKPKIAEGIKDYSSTAQNSFLPLQMPSYLSLQMVHIKAAGTIFHFFPLCSLLLLSAFKQSKTTGPSQTLTSPKTYHIN